MEHFAATLSIDDVRRACEELEPKLAEAMPEALVAAIEHLRYTVQPAMLSENLGGLGGPLLTLVASFDRFLKTRDKHRPARIYGKQE